MVRKGIGMGDLAALASKQQLDEQDRSQITAVVKAALGITAYPASLVTANSCIFGVGRD